MASRASSMAPAGSEGSQGRKFDFLSPLKKLAGRIGSSKHLPLRDMLKFSNERIIKALDAGLESKRGAGQLSVMEPLPGSDEVGCICVMSSQKYPEFNSTALGTTMPRRIRLYMLAAVKNTRDYYGITDEAGNQGLRAWIDANVVEASHLCRYIDDEDGVLVTFPDGTQKRCPVVKECSCCFQPEHVVLEPQAYNRSRINCTGGQNCRHQPKCILVPKPRMP